MNNYLAERVAIQYILHTGDTEFLEQNDLTASFFYLKGKEIQYILGHKEKYDKVPSYNEFILEFNDWELGDAMPDESLQAVVEGLKYNKAISDYALLMNTIRNTQFDSTNLDFDQLQTIIMSTARQLNDIAAVAAPIQYHSDFSECLLKLYNERREHPTDHFFATGFNWLDKMFSGGWDKDSEYAVVAGRPGTGKSMFLCYSALRALKDGKKVVFYAGEMSIEDIVNRIIVCDIHIDQEDIKHGSMVTMSTYENYVKNVLPKYNLYLLTPADLNSKKATAIQLETLCRKVGADILFIDQQSNMEDLDHAKVSWERAGNISRQIKAMRDRLNIPVICAVQLNRTTNADGSRDTAQLAGSDVIAQDATKVIILERNKEEQELKFNIAKNRSGPAFVNQLYSIDFNKGIYEEISSFNEPTTSEQSEYKHVNWEE